MAGGPTEFGGHYNRNGIMSETDPDGRPGHELEPHERLRLMYLTGQEPDEPDRNAVADPVYFEGNMPLPPDLRAPKYANRRVGGFVEEE